MEYFDHRFEDDTYTESLIFPELSSDDILTVRVVMFLIMTAELIYRNTRYGVETFIRYFTNWCLFMTWAYLGLTVLSFEPSTESWGILDPRNLATLIGGMMMVGNAVTTVTSWLIIHPLWLYYDDSWYWF